MSNEIKNDNEQKTTGKKVWGYIAIVGIAVLLSIFTVVIINL